MMSMWHPRYVCALRALWMDQIGLDPPQDVSPEHFCTQGAYAGRGFAEEKPGLSSCYDLT